MLNQQPPVMFVLISRKHLNKIIAFLNKYQRTDYAYLLAQLCSINTQLKPCVNMIICSGAPALAKTNKQTTQLNTKRESMYLFMRTLVLNNLGMPFVYIVLIDKSPHIPPIFSRLYSRCILRVY